MFQQQAYDKIKTEIIVYSVHLVIINYLHQLYTFSPRNFNSSYKQGFSRNYIINLKYPAGKKNSTSVKN